MRIAATVQYNGKGFSGFQIQNDARTVQGELERSLSTYFRVAIRVHAAGRTDAGVHSYGQVVHFELPEQQKFSDAELTKIIHSANCILPADVSFVYAKVVSDEFHARFSCTGREYVYQVLRSDYRLALFNDTHLWIRDFVDVQKMRESAKCLIGEHDFASFTRHVYSQSGETTVRRLDKLIITEADPFYSIYFSGSGFLHNMIRIITGALLNVGLGKWDPLEVNKILLEKSRIHEGVTFPAHPLTFVNARYKDYKTPENLIPGYDTMTSG